MNNYYIQDSTLNLIKQFEGVRYEMYKDSAGLPTVGVGHLIKPQESYLLTGKINESTVNSLLTADAKVSADAVNKFVHIELKQNQFDALVSFTFNLGTGALLNSTLLKNINSGQPVTEANFTVWDKIHKDGQLVECEGIKHRREKEYQLFIS